MDELSVSVIKDLDGSVTVHFFKNQENIMLVEYQTIDDAMEKAAFFIHTGDISNI